jgi:uncharacterized protein YdeI (YjbR/CyaY-like superfamily)
VARDERIDEGLALARRGDASELLALLQPPELVAVHTNMPATIPDDIAKALAAGGPAPSGLPTDEERAWHQLDFFYRCAPPSDRSASSPGAARACEHDAVAGTSNAASTPTKSFASSEKFAAWLARNHASSNGVWVKLAKQGSGAKSLSYAEAVEVALCYGWIDGQKKPFDNRFWLQRFTPRGPRSKWSKINRHKATALIEAGRMHDAGLQEVERAQADGRWDAAYDSPSRATVPDDLQRALDRDRKAKAFFDALDRTNRYAILYRVHDAKKPETRARRIEQFVAMLHRGEKLHP